MSKAMKVYLSVGVAGLILMTVLVSQGIPSSNTKRDSLRLRLRQPNTSELTQVTINSWDYLIGNDGTYFANAAATKAGGFYPRSATSHYDAVYAAGLYVGTKKLGVSGAMDTITVSDVEFSSEMQPGKLLVGDLKDVSGYRGDMTYDPANTVTGSLGIIGYESPDLSEYQSYYIDKTSEENSTADWNAWKEITYMPRTSEGKPGLVADGQTYGVFHDMEKFLQNPPTTYEMSPGLGLEIEAESFAFATGGAANALASVVFVKLSITNKSDVDWTSSYLGAWMDADIGATSSTDLANVDPLAGLGYVYNGDNDASNTATGFDFFQGPLVSAADVSQDLVDRFSDNDKVLKYNPGTNTYDVVDLPAGQFTLGATMFVAYRNGQGDPGATTSKEDVTRYNYLQGFDQDGLPKAGGPYDPWLGGSLGDQRIIHGVGPFILRSGATQEIWLGIVGGQGNTNLVTSSNSGVARMRTNDDVAQRAFSSGFAQPMVPFEPTLTVSGLDDQVVLTWDNYAESSFDNYGIRQGIFAGPGSSYNRNYESYDFQGYKVYRSVTGDSWQLLAQYDKEDGITTIRDTVSAADGGLLISNKVIGTDSGLRHYFVDTDVTMGIRYLYSVTAYDFQPMYYVGGVPVNSEAGEAIPRSMENAITGIKNLKSVVPVPPVAGSAYDASIANVTQIAGINENLSFGKRIELTVLDPKKVTSRSFRLEFFTLPYDDVDGRILVGGLAGQLAYCLIDDATDDTVQLYQTDNVLTFLDSNGNGTLDVESSGKITTASGDRAYDDRFFSTAYMTKDASGAIVSTTSSLYPIVDGVEIRPVHISAPSVLDVVQLSNGNTEMATPASVLQRPSADGKWMIQGANPWSVETLYSSVASSLKFVDSAMVTRNSDYEIRVNSGYSDTGYTRSAILQPTSNANFKVPSNLSIYDVGQLLNGSNSDVTNDTLLVAKFLDRFGPYSWSEVPGFKSTRLFSFDTSMSASSGVAKFVTPAITAIRRPVHPLPGVAFPTASGATANADVAFSGLVFRAIVGSATDTAAFFANPSAWLPSAGTKIRIVTAKPFVPGDKFQISVNASTVATKSTTKAALKKVTVVPNPYYGRASSYQRDAYDKQVRFFGLPDICTIRIFDVVGNLVRTIQHNEASTNLRVNEDPLDAVYEGAGQSTSAEVWDLRNRRGQYVGSGMYIAVVSNSAGKTTVKFAVIQEENRTEVAE